MASWGQQWKKGAVSVGGGYPQPQRYLKRNGLFFDEAVSIHRSPRPFVILLGVQFLRLSVLRGGGTFQFPSLFRGEMEGTASFREGKSTYIFSGTDILNVGDLWENIQFHMRKSVGLYNLLPW